MEKLSLFFIMLFREGCKGSVKTHEQRKFTSLFVCTHVCRDACACVQMLMSQWCADRNLLSGLVSNLPKIISSLSDQHRVALFIINGAGPALGSRHGHMSFWGFFSFFLVPPCTFCLQGRLIC